MNWKYIIVFIVIVGVIIFIFQYFPVSKEGKEEQEETQVPMIETKEVEPRAEKKESVLEIASGGLGNQVAPLTAVDGSNSSGAGYRLFKDGKLYHAVMASMPDPREGNVYEGWLVQSSPLQFFSTGVMQKKEDVWILEYTSDNEYPSYTKVVITEETVVDAKPEIHIIEGNF